MRIRYCWLVLMLLVSVLLGGCSRPDDTLVHSVEVVVGADVRTIETGQLEAGLYAYDPYLADVAPDTLDIQQLSFSHTQGSTTTTTMTLRGVVTEGFEVFLTVDGYLSTGGDRARLLWDGQEDTGMPIRVMMQELPD